MPKDWTEHRERCRAAGIDDKVAFATKQVLARHMIELALRAEVPFGWVTADEFCGQDTKFRLWLESVDVPHVVSVPKNAMVVSMELLKVRVHRLISELPDTAWQRLSAGDGVKGPRVSDWVVFDTRPLRRREWGHWLLALTKKRGSISGADHSLIPLSVNEIRRLWNRVVNRGTHTVDHVLRWST